VHRIEVPSGDPVFGDEPALRIDQLLALNVQSLEQEPLETAEECGAQLQLREQSGIVDFCFDRNHGS